MAVIPALTWTAARVLTGGAVSASGTDWEQVNSPNGQPPSPITLTRPQTVQLIMSTVGSVSFTITGDTTKGSYGITNVSPTADLIGSQTITGPGLPNGCYISSIVGSTITFFRGMTPMPATATATGVTFTIGTDAPVGSLAVTVTPSTGVTITDQNGGPSGGNTGNGTAIVNCADQGEGNVEIAFANAGTFVVSVAFTTADPNYANATVPDPITFVVT